MAYYVEIVECADEGEYDDVVIKILGPYITQREAEKAERGVDQRIDPERYYSQLMRRN